MLAAVNGYGLFLAMAGESQLPSYARNTIQDALGSMSITTAQTNSHCQGIKNPLDSHKLQHEAQTHRILIS